MKIHFHLLLLAVFAPSIIHAFTNNSFLTYRSQGFNLARNVAGWQTLRTNIFNGDDRGNASLAVEYTQSFDSDALNCYFFGGNNLVFSGSRVENRGSCDIMADYFGLPTDFESCVSFCPRMRNVIADFNFYWNLDCFIEGFNLRVNIPIASSTWELNPCETVVNAGTLAYPAGYMSRDRINHDDLQTGALDVLSCNETFGDLTSPLQYGRINRCKEQVTKLADIFVDLGYTFIRHRSGLIGANVQVVVPTGTRSYACTLFEPQVGNGHHWALGFGVTARYDFIDDLERDLKVSACFDGALQHLFKTRERRSYDLCNGPGSRYMLLEDMVQSIAATENFDPMLFVDQIDKQYITRLLYAINATTLDSMIKINVQADIVAKLTVDYGNWNCDIGYSFWGRSAETLVCREKLDHKFYGIKGDAQVYGFIGIAPGTFIPLPLNATQSNATLHAGQGTIVNTLDNFVNNNADNAALVWNATVPLAQTDANSLSGTGATAMAQVHGSNQQVTLTDCDINNCSGLSPRAFTNKAFGSLAYTWRDCNHVTPYLSAGAEGEFSGSTDGIKTAISQWGAWVKGGFNY